MTYKKIMGRLTQNLEKFSRLYPKETAQIAKESPIELPKIDADAWIQTLALDQVVEIIVYGVGNGETYHALKKWLHQRYDRVLIYIEEDLKVLRNLLENEAGSQILMDDQVELLYLNRKEGSGTLFNRLMWQSYGKKRLVVNDPRTYPELLNYLQKMLHYDSDKMDWVGKEYKTFGLGYYFNYYQNLKLFPKAFDGTALFNKAKNMPAIIVGAGPSLNKNGHLLHDLKDKALIFAGGSSLPALKSFDIKPHFGGGVDPNVSQYERLSSYGKIDFPYLFCSRINAGALRWPQGPLLYVPGTGGYETAHWLNSKLGIPTTEYEEGFSIIHFFTELAFRMGCNPIIYVGLDLSFPNGEQYANGVTIPEQFPDDLIQVEDLNKKMIQTRWMWLKESNWLTAYADSHPSLQLINATEGGIPTKGIPNWALNEVIEKKLKKSLDFGDLFTFKSLNVSIEQIEKELSILFKSLQRLQGIFEEMSQFYQQINLINYNPKDLLFPEGADWYSKLEAEPAFAAIIQVFHRYCCTLISNSHLIYLITRDGMNSKFAKHVIELHLQKINYLKEVVNGQIQLLHNNYGFE